MGRKSTFTQEIADEILRRLSSGEPLAQICRDEDMPAVRTVNDWAQNDLEGFGAGFARARSEGFDQIAADALRIADTPIEGVIEKLEPVTVPDPDGGEGATKLELQVVERRREDMLGHRKLQIETRLKLLAKWDPKRYGEKLELAGSKDSPLTVEIVRLATEPTK